MITPPANTPSFETINSKPKQPTNETNTQRYTAMLTNVISLFRRRKARCPKLDLMETLIQKIKRRI